MSILRPMPTAPPGRRLALVAVLLSVLAGCAPPSGDAPSPAAEETDLMTPPPLVEATLADLQAAIRDGRTTCVAVVRGYLERIAAFDAARGIHAITATNPGALERAAELDAALARGEDPGALACAPILVKDNLDTGDLPTTGGSVRLAGSIPPDDATMVRRLRAAGAIVLAKTNMAEWAFSPRQTVSSSHGRTANAYSTAHTPAGSSGGTASGVAASFAVAGLGSDTGNSIRGPAAHLALFGIRSTLGLTSRDGVIPLLLDRDVAGPLTRTVEDGARLFDVIAGSDPADPYTAEADARRAADYTAGLTANALVGARIGVLRALADPAESDAEVLALFDAALADLEAAGAELVDPLVIPDLETHLAADLGCNRFRHDLATYLDSLDDPPFRDVREVLAAGDFHADSRGALEYFSEGPIDGPPPTWETPCPEYADHPGRQAFLAAVTGAMDAAGVDAIAHPGWTWPPAPIDSAVEDYRGDNSQLIAPDTGMPAVNVPMGFTRDGTLPAGLQLLGRRWDDHRLIRYAYAYEQATRHRRPPPGFPELEESGD
jgi:Asp-tRNA(Asn)/Glu-tRNA(Gln) amidotransferase A subunit family amidase